MTRTSPCEVDRLTRSLADFAKIVDVLDAHNASFVSVTQQFNTTTSMGRLTLNMLLSFAQFEREIAGERIRDKIVASKKKGMWMGGNVPLGYDVKDRKLTVNETEAATVRLIFRRYAELGSVARARAITAPTKASPVSSPTTPSKPRPIRSASSAAQSGPGNTPTGNGSQSGRRPPRGISAGEDIEQAVLTLHPAQAAAEGATREHLERIGAHGALIIDWLDAAPLDAVPWASSPTASSPRRMRYGRRGRRRSWQNLRATASIGRPCRQRRSEPWSLTS